MKHFRFYSKPDILSLTKVRKYETRLGERISFLMPDVEWPQVLQESEAPYVLLGIPEDIGVRANLGRGGADTSWLPFLDAFLNIQSNDYLTGEQILLLGHFDFGDIKYLIENNAYTQDEKINAYRHAVNLIDEEVENLVKVIAAAGKIPIIIGGGHNNAYPIIKGVAKGLHKSEKIPLSQINCINMDVHADYRTMEGRHSGNAFRYAEADGYLGKYAIVGLQENYLAQSVLMDIQQNPFIHFSSFEDILIHEKLNFIQSVSHATGFTEDSLCGIEVDMDSIQDALSSACTPCGFSPLQARQFVNFTATDAKVAYLHISEGASQISDSIKDDSTGKMIAYLVSDFVKANSFGKSGA
ncbi:MAG: arginase family protein [Ferruginibacter sp.]